VADAGSDTEGKTRINADGHREGTEKEKMENGKWKREKRNNGENTGLEYGSPAAAHAILGNGASPKAGAGLPHSKS
jgi:hypothetical protein